MQTARYVGTVRHSVLLGTVLRVARGNALLCVDYQPAPDGPVFVQEHCVPLDRLEWVQRGDVLCEVVDP